MLGKLICFVVVMASVMQTQATDSISTYAGVQTPFGSSSGDGGPASSAKLDTPYGVWVNTAGVTFVCELFRIRQISSSGIISAYFGSGLITVAGNGGAATAAAGNPMSVWGDSVGNIYFSESGDYFRKISSSGIVNKFAGGGTLTTENAPATQALFGGAFSVFGDTLGNIYVLSKNHQKVKKVATSTLLVTTFAGNGGGSRYDTSAIAGDGGAATSVSLYSPTSGCLDSSLNVYLSSDGGGWVRKIGLTTSIVTLVAGGSGAQGYSGDMGPATNALLLYSVSIVGTDTAGTIYYGTISTGSFRYIDTNGIIGPYAGTAGAYRGYGGYGGDGGAPTSAFMNTPNGISANGAFVYVSEKMNNIVRRVTAASEPVSVAFAGYTTLEPSIVPSKSPSVVPTVQPTVAPTFVPTSISPSTVPSTTPSATPTITPSLAPSMCPTIKPSIKPSVIPTVGPSALPSVRPSLVPSVVPTASSAAPSVMPTCTPSLIPTMVPTTLKPSVVPTVIPTAAPTTTQPTISPSILPSILPSMVPTEMPTTKPTIVPSVIPTAVPTVVPTTSPTEVPTVLPTELPTVLPSVVPSNPPSVLPTFMPSVVPSINPTTTPTVIPTVFPSVVPSDAPTVKPTLPPSVVPTVRPTAPTKAPTKPPTVKPTRAGITVVPTFSPSVAPTAKPTDAIAITFNSDLYLHNVTTTELGATEQSAVVGAVAVTLSLGSSQVTFLSQELIGVDGQQQQQQRLRRLTAGDVPSYQIMVSVNVWASTRDLEDVGQQNASYLYNRLTTTLTTAVATNAFTATVRSVSAEMKAMNTLYVGQVDLNVTDYTVITLSTPSDHRRHYHGELSTGDFAGIVIGVLMSVVLVIVGCYYGTLWLRRESPPYTLKL